MTNHPFGVEALTAFLNSFTQLGGSEVFGNEGDWFPYVIFYPPDGGKNNPFSLQYTVLDHRKHYKYYVLIVYYNFYWYRIRALKALDRKIRILSPRSVREKFHSLSFF